MAEVGSDEAGVARLLAQPGRGGVTERMGGDALLDRGSISCAADDPAEDRFRRLDDCSAAEDMLSVVFLEAWREYDDWDTIYAEAAEGLDVLPAVAEAVVWANDLIARAG